MNVPALIPIRHEPDWRTDAIGRCQDGQFFASAVWADGRPYAVLHRFDPAGRHLESSIRAVGTAAEARRLLDEWLDALPERAYGDIAIAQFSVEVDGVLFGLLLDEEEADEDDEGGEDEGPWVELRPDGLGFHAPWDGCYDT
ncbi:hypothetical protein [Kitasatospora sp. NPDC059827]|uniref:hypothetical protein n=1 Tax=Kitasatospora sp. NPDC059827 TaxID=3346964 RepID=UPI003660876D